MYQIQVALCEQALIDIAAVTAVQMDMLKQLATAYGADYSASKGKVFVGALTGGMVARVGASAVKALPGVGTVLGGMSMSALSGASTYAVAKVAVGIFESGGNLHGTDLDSAKAKYEETIEQGKKYVNDLKQADESAPDTFQKLEKLGELSPNPPKDTDGRREESGRGVRELQGK